MWPSYFFLASDKSATNSAHAPPAPAPALLDCTPKRRQMPHFPPHARRRFPVEMQLDVRHGQRRGPIGLAVLPEVAQQVGHGRRPQQFGGAQRQPADGPHLLLELAGHGGVDGEVARVVRARRQLVDEQPAVARSRKSSTQSTPTTPAARAPSRAISTASRRAAGGHGAGATETSRMWCAVGVLDHALMGEGRRPTPRAATTDTSRSKSTNASSMASCRPMAAQAARRSVPGVDAHLALAVVAEGGGLEDGRACRACQRPASARPACGPAANGATGRPAAPETASPAAAAAWCGAPTRRGARARPRPLPPRPPPPARSRTRR